MSEASLGQPADHLRRDLSSLIRRGERRSYRVIVDDIAGRFTRVPEHLWSTLQLNEHDDGAWQQARSAGWTRERVAAKRRQISPLYLRIPIAPVDWLAAMLAPLTGWLFSPISVLLWSALILIASLLAIGRSAELVASLGSLDVFLQRASPFWLGVTLVTTKVLHELGHAIMCRRMGSRCGRIGILLLCGVPCPYCDVTDIWRQSSSIRRAAVMLAGIYIELILASIATVVWVLSHDPTVRFHALNLMIVCGISTIVFNANPLMRYDGYYVLCDLVGSTNLRQEAQTAFRSFVTARIAGTAYADQPSGGRRAIGLTLYNAASTVYRWVVMVAIGGLVLGVSEYAQMRGLGIGILLLVLAAVMLRWLRRAGNVVLGNERWSAVSGRRRSLITIGTCLLLAAVLLEPLPRYRRVDGFVDAAGATSVYLASEGTIEDVALDYGDRAEQGDRMVKVRSESLAFQHAKLRGELRVATLRGDISRRGSLDGRSRQAQSNAAQQWNTLQAAEEAVAARLASTKDRIRKLDVLAPIGGIVVPEKPVIPAGTAASARSLSQQDGAAANAYQAWCRISSDGSLHAVLVLDARDRGDVEIGSPVTLTLRHSPRHRYESKVESVSAIQQDTPSLTRRAAYQVTCPLPPVADEEVLRWIGKECSGVFMLPKCSVAVDLYQWFGRWLSGDDE